MRFIHKLVVVFGLVVGFFGLILSCATPIPLGMNVPEHQTPVGTIPRAVEQRIAGLETLWVHDLGFDPDDSTDYLQAAIRSGSPVIIISAEPGPWITRTLFLASNQIIVFESGAQLIAMRGEYAGRGDRVMRGNLVENLEIYGYGAEISMHKQDYQSRDYRAGEWRHGISIHSGTNVIIEGLTIRNTGGDGVYVGRQPRSDQFGSKNVTLRNLHLIDNHRQGISVVSVDGLLIEGCLIENTSGTLPMAGIDFEPDRPIEFITNVLVRDTVILNNKGAGILFAFQNLRPESQPIDITIQDTYLWGNVFNTLSIGARRATGTIRFQNVRRGWFNFLPRGGLVVQRSS